MVFPVVIYRCESWTIKKDEHWRIDAFELWCWRRLLRAPWTARRSSQAIIKEISPGCSLEGLMLKLKLQYFSHLMGRAESLEKTWFWEGLKAGEGDDRGQDGWMASPAQWTWVWTKSRRWWRTGRLGMWKSMGVTESWAQLSDWTTNFIIQGLPRWHSCKEAACRCRRYRKYGLGPLVAKISWRRKWQPTLVFLLGKLHGQRNLAGYSPQGCKESDRLSISTIPFYMVCFTCLLKNLGLCLSDNHWVMFDSLRPHE